MSGLSSLLDDFAHSMLASAFMVAGSGGGLYAVTHGVYSTMSFVNVSLLNNSAEGFSLDCMSETLVCSGVANFL